MDTVKALEQEKAELNALINKGISFEVVDIEFQEKRVFFGLVKRYVPVKVSKQFHIQELTLGTLDRLSAEWIEFAIDEEIMQSNDGMQRARTLIKEHSLRCSKIVAIAVLDADILIPKYGKNGVVRYVEDIERLEYLTALFYRTIKPSKLYQLNVLINTMCNLGDFVNSIRLMCADRTTIPIRIEQNNEV